METQAENISEPMSDEEIRAEIQRMRAAAEAADAEVPAPQDGEPQKSDFYPPGFFQRTEGEDAGLWHTEIGKDDEPVETKIGPNLFVLGQTRDDNGKSWGLLLAWQDPDGDGHKWAMPKSMLEGDPAEYRKRLADEGWSPAPNRRARALLAEFLAAARPETRVRCVPRTGWHGSAYVFPDETIDEEANHA